MLSRACWIVWLLVGPCAQVVAQPREGEPEPPPWYDKAHTLLSGSAQRTALWFDHFFGPSDDADQASSHFRLRAQREFIERESDQWGLRLSAAYYLPQTERRLKLLLESDEEDEELGDLFTGTGEGTTRAALRWIPLDRKRWDLSLDLGASVDSGIQPFVRGRARYYDNLDQRTLLKASQELRLQSDEGWSETTGLNLERHSDGHALLWRNWLFYGEESDGLEWNSKLSRVEWLNERTALSLFVAASGATDDPGIQSEIRRLGLTLRQSFLRSWLFYEVEPQLTWPRQYGFDTNLELTLTLEAQFGQRR
ncbi:hypothetical protein FCL40_01845 [Ferrimonas sediminicola]|uniref:DUF481 domain-containing protein n=1 Tax=Ferrimonas sediminicola TaxID=2569538 RepID=A0A4U1BKI7_9GAMM|nr:hypothetical protein [Ferrimonas sediminicola]TKB51324.1 hypothetical protein FCL40_01845 [Ferrimonas sediminicola]